MNRIRYKTSNEGTLESVRIFMVGIKHLTVRLELGTLTYTVSDAITKDAISTGSAKSLHSLKIAAKEALKDLGVSFTLENRDATNEKLS